MTPKQEEKMIYASAFLICIVVIFWKLDALMAFITNAFFAAAALVGAYFFGKKWLELDK